MKCYLAASWSRRREIKRIAKQLRKSGVEVTSGWLEDEKFQAGAKKKFFRGRAFIDLNDVDRADALIRFTDELKTKRVSAKLISGGKMVEFGYALARGKAIYVVGGHQNIFDFLPQVIHLKNVKELCRVLSQEE